MPFKLHMLMQLIIPISFIDFLGLGPIYGPDGTIIGYMVEAGQGPTQIAQDLNENYSCDLSCEVNWVQIVLDNEKMFKNVFEGPGEIDDKYNGDYKQGNIEEGQELVIAGGLEGGRNGEREALKNEYRLTREKTIGK